MAFICVGIVAVPITTTVVGSIQHETRTEPTFGKVLPRRGPTNGRCPTPTTSSKPSPASRASTTRPPPRTAIASPATTTTPAGTSSTARPASVTRRATARCRATPGGGRVERRRRPGVLPPRRGRQRAERRPRYRRGWPHGGRNRTRRRNGWPGIPRRRGRRRRHAPLGVDPRRSDEPLSPRPRGRRNREDHGLRARSVRRVALAGLRADRLRDQRTGRFR